MKNNIDNPNAILGQRNALMAFYLQFNLRTDAWNSSTKSKKPCPRTDKAFL